MSKTEKNILTNAVDISSDNPSIMRINDLCVNCGICTQTCIIREGINFKDNSSLCVYCGQCIQTCPVKSLIPKFEYNLFEKAKKDGKVCIAYISPASKTSIGEILGCDYGTFEDKKLVGLLKHLGFDYVFDTSFAADLTIMEEASELVSRIKNKNKLPLLTSCCPAWVKYAEEFYPELLPNISSCKSPIGMMGSVILEYFCKVNNLNKDDIYTVAITPCTAKKYEIKRSEIEGTNLVITINELESIIKSKNIKFDDIESSNYDSLFGEGSGAGIIFGSTGGVTEAALRTAYYLLTNKKLESDKLVFNDIRGHDNIKEVSINIDGDIINVCVINGITNAKNILEDIKNNNSKYHFVEVMNCTGGCIGGGGQPKVAISKEKEVKNMRMNSLYKRDEEIKVRCSYNNPNIIKIYNDFFGKPLSNKALELLHTKYEDKSYLNNNK
jgi:ferredoxin hydrogenase